MQEMSLYSVHPTSLKFLYSNPSESSPNVISSLDFSYLTITREKSDWLAICIKNIWFSQRKFRLNLGLFSFNPPLTLRRKREEGVGGEKLGLTNRCGSANYVRICGINLCQNLHFELNMNVDEIFWYFIRFFQIQWYTFDTLITIKVAGFSKDFYFHNCNVTNLCSYSASIQAQNI